MGKFEKINHRFAIVEYPITLQEMDEIKMEFPKSERAFYEITLKALKKSLKPTDEIFGFEGVQPTFTHMGFLVLMQNEVILSIHKGGLMPSATLERIPMNKITEVDFDIIPAPINPFNVNEGEIHITYKKGFGSKKYTIRNVSTVNLDSLVARIRGFVKATV